MEALTQTSTQMNVVLISTCGSVKKVFQFDRPTNSGDGAIMSQLVKLSPMFANMGT